MGNWTNRLHTYFENIDNYNKLFQIKNANHTKEEDLIVDVDALEKGENQQRKKSIGGVEKKRKMSNLGESIT